MSIELAEQLKREWTDKYVVVHPDVPELRRFQHLTGTVKTVNMNCRALVQFDGPEDISWYDIDLDHLRIVDAPKPKKKAAEEAKPAAEKPAAKAAPAKTGGKSPLQMAREQAGGGGKAAAPPAGKKLSPLELARQQAAAKTGGEAAPKAEEAPAPPPAKPADDAGKKLSPIERARMQDAKKNG
jgi:hypothetical protein